MSKTHTKKITAGQRNKKKTWVRGNPSRVPESVVPRSTSVLPQSKHPLAGT